MRISNWFEYSKEKEKFVFDKTLNHIFAPYYNGGKRIGDMSLDELIQVIAVGYDDREILAKAIISLNFNVDNDTSTAMEIAKSIMENLGNGSNSGSSMGKAAG